MSFYFDRITFLVIVQSSITFMASKLRLSRTLSALSMRTSLSLLGVVRGHTLLSVRLNFERICQSCCTLTNYLCCSIHRHFITYTLRDVFRSLLPASAFTCSQPRTHTHHVSFLVFFYLRISLLDRPRVGFSYFHILSFSKLERALRYYNLR